MSGEFAVGGELDSLAGGFGGHGGGIGNEERHDEFVPVAHDHSIKDVRTGLERIFDGLRGDEFACRGFQQVFLAVGDEEIIVLVHVADIARAEPTVFGENFTGGFGIFIVTLHDAGAFDEDFSILGNTDLNVGNRFAGTAHAIIGIV